MLRHATFRIPVRCHRSSIQFKNQLLLFSSDTETLTSKKPPGPKIPTLEQVLKQDYKDDRVQGLSNQSIGILAAQEDYATTLDAACERMRREIMRVDNVSWDEAEMRLQGMNRIDRDLAVVRVGTVPHKVGIFIAIVAGFGCIPLIYSKKAVTWFNHKFVTMDVPEPEDLETMAEVSNWAWNWMEPATGLACTVLLALQFSRGQFNNLGYAPYTGWLRNRRAQQMALAFPQYNRRIVEQYSRNDRLP